MAGPITRYIRWLHTQWPAGHVEKLPEVGPHGATNVPGLHIVGDLTGIPLLKFSSDTGARAVQAIVEDNDFRARKREDDVRDLVVIGAGVSGVAAMAEATKADLDALLIEATQPFDTVANFPKGKPIYTYPTDMTPAGDLQFGERAATKEGLVDELQSFLAAHDITPLIARVEKVTRRGGLLEVAVAGAETIKTHRVIVGIGRSGNFRKLGVAGEELPKVFNRLHDPKDFKKKHVVVVGGGDSALETAIALEQSGAFVTLSYRKPEFARPKPDNIAAINAIADNPLIEVEVENPVSERVTTAAGAYQRPDRHGSLTLMMASKIKEVRADEVDITNAKGEDETLPNDAVFSMLGREPPLDFFRRSGVRIRGEWSAKAWIGLIVFFAFCTFVYHWKSDFGIPINAWFKDRGWFPFNVAEAANPANLFGTILISMHKPSFYYTLAYTTCIVVFGIRRVRRRRTPYVKLQTTTLAAIQLVPLFILPFILLPWAGHNGWFEAGLGRSIADALFPLSEWDAHGREYWRSVGFILAWPLMFWNVFTDQPIMAWLVISLVQTFVIIPLIVWRWGKGAYCGWICSCGALAETMGDAHRHKMPHGPKWNRLNLVGQVFLVLAFVLLALRLASWITPADSGLGRLFDSGYMMGLFGRRADWSSLGFPFTFVNYAWFVDLLWAGIFGVAFYFWFSGRVWCRFACPLAALMHIYARFSQFRIVTEKSKCISCNVCTSVCHQGIDIMNFANKGLPMEDPQCVRCSACVQSCPTGVLQFGRVNRKTGAVLGVDRIPASPVLMAELTVNGNAMR